jgi:hypothetical protein
MTRAANMTHLPGAIYYVIDFLVYIIFPKQPKTLRTNPNFYCVGRRAAGAPSGCTVLVYVI